MPQTPPSSLVTQLNDLISLHHGSLIRHFSEAQPHVSARTWQAWRELSKLQEHRMSRVQLLVDILINELYAQPCPVEFEQNVGFAHFLTLDAWLPQLLAELDKTKAKLTNLIPSSITKVDCKIQDAIALCDEDIAAINLAAKLIISTSSTLA